MFWECDMVGVVCWGIICGAHVMFWLGSEDNTQQGRDSKSAKQQSITKHEKGFLQKLKDVFWKDEEKEPKVEEILDKDKHKMS